jgi:hypothetical protein
MFFSGQALSGIEQYGICKIFEECRKYGKIILLLDLLAAEGYDDNKYTIKYSVI